MKKTSLYLLCVALVVVVSAQLAPAIAQNSLTELVAAHGRPETKPVRLQPADEGIRVVESVTFYTDRAEFEGEFPGLTLTDFSASTIPAGGIDAIPHPLDSTSDNAFFSPGDIAEGIQFWASQDRFGEELVVVGIGFAGNPDIQVLANTFDDLFEIHFTQNVNTAGFNVVDHLGSGTCSVAVYDPSDTLIAETTSPCDVAGTAFLGIHAGQGIGRIVLSSDGNGAEGTAYVLFGEISSQATVTVEVGPGGGGTVSGGGMYDIGQEATVQAFPSPGWVFLHWLDNGNEIPDNPYTFLVTQDITLTAIFELQEIEAIPAMGYVGLALLLALLAGVAVFVLRRM